MIRVGNGSYAKENKSYGLTTLLNRHVKVDGSELKFHFKGKSGKEWRLTDVLTKETFDRNGSEMRDAGLYVELGPWKCHLFEVQAR